MSTVPSNRYISGRPAILATAKLLFVGLCRLPIAQAIPVNVASLFKTDEPEGKPPNDPSLWLYLGVAAALVLLGGAFAGLTIALMGQDEIYLQVIRTSGEGSEKKNAARVLRLLNKGKHWVLVTLLLSNVITNETLPIVLDRSLGGGWPAVLGSTVLIVIFGEIVPQSICVRFGLPIGAWMYPFVLALMYIMAPVAWPTAKLLDYLLGEDHGTVYKKAGLKTLVTLHKSLGAAGEQLNSDEVTIISAVLDLKEKPVGAIMTPMDDVFTLSADDILDEKTMEMILSQGYSRIPVYSPQHHQDFVGMLLVKMLITYDPEDCKPVRDFALATLPETSPATSCLDIVNFFQEGKSHMVLVSEHPGEAYGALGVCTLEDVIEELIGEEIIDESDVFIDVHKAIRRLAPAPRTRVPKGHVYAPPNADGDGQEGNLIDISEDQTLSPAELQRTRTQDAPPLKRNSVTEHGSPRAATFLMRRRSSTAGSDKGSPGVLQKRATGTEIREHLKHIGPSNLASRPRQTRWNTVKIKPPSASTTYTNGISAIDSRRVSDISAIQVQAAPEGGIGEGLLDSAGKSAKDGVQALHQGYGAIDHHSPNSRPVSSTSKAVQVNVDGPSSEITDSWDESRQPRSLHRPDSANSSKSHGHSTVGSLRDERSGSPSYTTRGPARSGSITEQIIDANGIRKVVLELTSSSSSNEEEENSGANKLPHSSHDSSAARKSGSGSSGGSQAKLRGGGGGHLEPPEDTTGAGDKKKRRRRRKKRGPGQGGEHELLLGERES